MAAKMRDRAMKYKCPDPECGAAVGDPCTHKRNRYGWSKALQGVHALRRDRVKRPFFYEQKEKEETERREKRAKEREERLNKKYKKVDDKKNPNCKKCGAVMVKRKRKDGSGDFWGCSKYPNCTGTRNLNLAKKLLDKVQETEPKTAAERIVKMVAMAREVVQTHNMTLPIGYRTTKHLAQLTSVLKGRAEDAWRLWIDGRVADTERAKFDAAGLPSGTFEHPATDDNPGWYQTLEDVLDEGLPVMLVGAAGTGKTRFAQWYAEMAEKQLHIVVGSGDIAGRELWVSRRDVTKGNITNVDGPATLAARNGEVLLLDEVDGFDANSLLPLNAPLNGEEFVSVPILGQIEIDPEMRIIAAANTNGRAKDRTYAARNRLDGAFLNRFAVIIRVTFDKEIDAKIVGEFLEVEKTTKKTTKKGE